MIINVVNYIINYTLNVCLLLTFIYSHIIKFCLSALTCDKIKVTSYRSFYISFNHLFSFLFYKRFPVQYSVIPFAFFINHSVISNKTLGLLDIPDTVDKPEMAIASFVFYEIANVIVELMHLNPVNPDPMYVICQHIYNEFDIKMSATDLLGFIGRADKMDFVDMNQYHLVNKYINYFQPSKIGLWNGNLYCLPENLLERKVMTIQNYIHKSTMLNKPLQIEASLQNIHPSIKLLNTPPYSSNIQSCFHHLKI